MFSFFFVFKKKTAYDMRISDWSSDVCSSDLELQYRRLGGRERGQHPDRVLRPAAQLVRVAAVQFLLSSMDAWESTAGFGPPFFVLPIRGDGQVDRPRGLRRDAGSCRPGAAFPSAGHPVLIRARAIHGALVATPGRQDTAHLDVNLVTSASTNVATTNCRRGVPIEIGRAHV